MPATEAHRIAVIVPAMVGAGAVVCTIVIHAMALGGTVSFARHERRAGRVGAGFWIDVAIAGLANAFAFTAHLVEIGIWGGVVHDLRRIPGLPGS